MSLKIDAKAAFLPKNGEELCGDAVEISQDKDSTAVVLADGLGSGVKANILSSLTAKMTLGMLKYGCDLPEVLEALANTLPICEVRHIAYSTFTILQIFSDGRAYLAEYDNPPAIMGRGKDLVDIPRSTRKIASRVIREAIFTVKEGDWIVLLSDGVVHAGIGGIWNLGWSHERIKSYLARVVPSFQDAQDVSDDLAHVCQRLYAGKIGDDVSIASIMVRKPRSLTMLIGLPKDRAQDKEVMKRFFERPGKKAVAGGSTSQMVARELGKNLKVNLGSMKNDLPPTGYIEGIDLVTEGTLTIERTLQYLKEGRKKVSLMYQPDGASRLCSMLYEMDDILILLGSAVNPAHQSPDLPVALQLKNRMVEDLSKVLSAMGKNVVIERY